MTNSSTDAPVTAALPKLTAMVVAFRGDPVLGQCLAALEAQAGSRVEVLVVFDVDGPCAAAAARLRARYARVRWIEAPPASTVPQLRTLAMQAGRGDIVALLEDDCVVEPGWCEAAVAAHESGDDVAIGGAVEPGPYRKSLDWAVYFCEYGRFMPPLRQPANLALALASNNVTYKRPPLMRATEGTGGFYDMAVHAAWQEAGLPMRTEPALVVRNVNSWSLPDVTSVPYHHGRTFAALRYPGRPVRRALYGALALGLPPLKVGRVIVDTVTRGRFTGRLLQAMPWIVVFMTCWSLGEAAGYIRGPGDSASRWR